MTKILYTTLQFAPCKGGTEKVIEEYNNYFKKIYSTKVIATNLNNFSPDKDLLKINDGVIRVPVIPSNNYLVRKFYFNFYKKYIGPLHSCDLGFPKRLKKILKKIDFDLLHVSGASHFINYWSIIEAKKRKKPVIITSAIHIVKDTYSFEKKKYLNFSIINCKKADAIICNTEVEKEYLISKGIQGNKCVVTGLGIHPNQYKKFKNNFKQQLNLKDDQKIILFIGRKEKPKGYQELISSLKYLKNKNVKLIFIGADQKDFKIPNDLKNKITNLKRAPDKVKLQALQNCDIFCLPSISESFGIVYLEAWIYEKPVIACDIPTSQEIISDGQDGLLVKQSPKDIAEKIDYLLKNPKIAKEMGQRGKKKVLKKYTWDKVMPKIEKIYEKLLNL